MRGYLDLPATAGETAELVHIVVRECGCGCTFGDGLLTSVEANCSAVEALSDRRFVLGVLFGRALREQLQAEEWRRAEPQAARSPAQAPWSNEHAG